MPGPSEDRRVVIPGGEALASIRGVSAAGLSHTVRGASSRRAYVEGPHRDANQDPDP